MRFSVTPPPGRRGAQPPRQAAGHYEKWLNWANALEQPPRQPAGHYGKWLNWANALEQPPARLRGGSCQGPQASAWGPAARKGAVWAEGLADGAPWVRPGHHQAASCGLRRYRELGLREFVWVVASLPWRRGGCHRQAAMQECTQIGENGLSEPFWGTCVHCCDASFTMRITSGGTSTSTTMACRWRPLAGRFSLGREDRLCASGAAVRLASSPRQQPTQIPDGPGSSGLYEGREGRPPREGPVTLDLLTRWPRHLGSVQSKGVIGPIVEWNPGDGLCGRADSR